MEGKVNYNNKARDQKETHQSCLFTIYNSVHPMKLRRERGYCIQEADFQLKRRSFMTTRSFKNSSISILADSSLGNTPDLPSENTTWVPIRHIYNESDPIRPEKHPSPRYINYDEREGSDFIDSDSKDESQDGRKRKNKVGRPFASKILSSKNYNERFDVLHKTIIRALLKSFGKTYRAMIGRLLKETNKGKAKKYNRSLISLEEFERWTSLFSTEIIKNREILILSNNMNFEIFEFYIRIMVDRKLAKRFYSKGKYNKRVAEFCEAIDNYSQNKFTDLLKSSELKTIFEILINGK